MSSATKREPQQRGQERDGRKRGQTPPPIRLKLRRECDDLAGEAISLLNLALVQYEQERYTEALNHADLSLAKSLAAGERENERKAYVIRAQIKLRTGKPGTRRTRRG